ncbi:MAG: insulinase family protein [Bacteroidetes bacterium]|nr:insulinase family protein [Bacteroidota bacterium]
MVRRHFIQFYITFLIITLIQVPELYALDTERTSEHKTQNQSLPKGVSIYQLDNGMEVLLIENPALPMVGVNVVVKVGSAYETFSTSGMCHMLEHLLFNGTTTRTQKQLYDDVDRIGGYNNASTADFYTNYMMVTPSENIRKGMEIQADMLFNSTLPVEKFEKEKGIVLEEISKSLANPQEQLERNANSILYSGHAISLPTLGTYSTIQAMSRDNVYSFYKNHYVPNNMILTAVGNFQTKTMLPLIKEIYGKVSPGLVKPDVIPGWSTGFQMPEVSIQQKEIIYNRFYDGQDVVLQLFYQLPRAESSEFFALLNIVLEKNKDAIQSSLKSEFPQLVKSLRLSTRSSPLKNFVEAVILLNKDADFNALVSSISTKLTNLSFVLSTETSKSEAIKARTEFLKNIEKPHMFGIYNSNELVINGIEAVIAAFSGNEFYQAAKRLEKLKIISNPIIIIQSPSVKKDGEKIEASHEIKLFKDETTGKNIIVIQNDVSNLLAIHYLVKHKAVYESKYGKDAAKVLHDCLEQRLKSEENQKRSNQYGFTFTVNDNPMIPMDDIYLHPDFGYIRVEGLADDLPGAINYLTSQLKDFVPTEEEFKKAIEKFKGISMMLMGGDKAKKLFDDTYKSIVYEPDPYSENQPALTYDNLLAFTKIYFQPANMIVSVVSPATPDSINILFSQFSSTSYTEEPPVYNKSLLLLQKDTAIEKEGKGERSYLFWGFTTQIDPKDTPALQALSLILSDNIVFDIREKQGMAYNMSAGIEVIEDKALFYINQGTRPQNVDKLISQYPRFFTMVAIDTLTQGGLEKSINMYLGRMMFRRLSSINQAYYLSNSFYFQNDFNYDKKFLDELKNVKLSDVKNVAKKYMKVKNQVLVIVR